MVPSRWRKGEACRLLMPVSPPEAGRRRQGSPRFAQATHASLPVAFSSRGLLLAALGRLNVAIAYTVVVAERNHLGLARVLFLSAMTGDALLLWTWISHKVLCS